MIRAISHRHTTHTHAHRSIRTRRDSRSRSRCAVVRQRAGGGATSRSRRASRLCHHQLSHRKWCDVADGAHRVRYVRSSQRRARQCGTVAVALHGQSPRLRVADWPRHGIGYSQTVSRRDRTVRQRILIVAKQYARTVAWSSLSHHDHSRQRRGGTQAARRRVARAAFARCHRILDGRTAGVPVGGELSLVHGPCRCDVGHSENIRPRHRAARRTDCRAHRRRNVQRGRLHRTTQGWPRSVRHGVGCVALLAGMVAQGVVAYQRRTGHNVRTGHARHGAPLQCRCEQLHPAGTHVAAT